jgi:hypothetical protein
MPRFVAVASAVSLSFLVACGDSPLGVDRDLKKLGTAGTAKLNDVDLDHTALGYHIPGTMPEHCWWGFNPDVPNNDADWDWLDDTCEYYLAHAFRPTFKHQSDDGCVAWEPYWATKGFGAGNRVRIAYMPAYFMDCGSWESHFGDSEMVTVQIVHDPASNHWMLESVWYSAHQGSFWQESRWWSWHDGVQWADLGRGRPVIWVAQRKHANYKSAWECNTNEEWPDQCNHSVTERLFPVFQNRNAGSRVRDLLGCVTSTTLNSDTGRCEHFYKLTEGESRFRGWFGPQPPEQWPRLGDSGAYHALLNTAAFEYLDTFGDWGPDHLSPPPNHNPPPGWYVNITGNSSIGPQIGCHWHVSVTGATAVSYSWRVDGQPMGSDSEWFSYSNNGNDFEISVVATVENGGQGTAYHNVSIVEGQYCE